LWRRTVLRTMQETERLRPAPMPRPQIPPPSR
jgi:hypothetical protein